LLAGPFPLVLRYQMGLRITVGDRRTIIDFVSRSVALTSPG
jgi:hypothetical protein